MTARKWSPGDIVAWREAWRGREYIAIPVRVIEDTDDELVVYVSEGTQYSFPPGGWPFAEQHPWAAQGGFIGHGILIVQRPGAAYSIWHFWKEEDRHFAGWYVNMQEPSRRDGISYVTQDHELDIWIEPDGTWAWKDEQELEDWVSRGRFTREEVTEIRRVGEQVLAEWPFPTGWENWEPDASWPVPVIPPEYA